MTDLLLSVVLVLFPVSEMALALMKRSRTRVAQRHDRCSMRLLWMSIVVGLVLANAIQWLPGGSLAATSGNWLSILGLLVPVTFGVVNRVTKEEQALLRSLGPEYAAYCARTKRFVPGLL